MQQESKLQLETCCGSLYGGEFAGQLHLGSWVEGSRVAVGKEPPAEGTGSEHNVWVAILQGTLDSWAQDKCC